MVLTPEERAELERLTAKETEPGPPPPDKIVKISHEALSVLKQLLQVTRHQVAGEVAQEIDTALNDAKDDAPAAPAAPLENPAAVSETPIADAAAGAVFGSETAPGEGG